jgi:hypothetical protein
MVADGKAVCVAIRSNISENAMSAVACLVFIKFTFSGSIVGRHCTKDTKCNTKLDLIARKAECTSYAVNMPLSSQSVRIHSHAVMRRPCPP